MSETKKTCCCKDCYDKIGSDYVKELIKNDKLTLNNITADSFKKKLREVFINNFRNAEKGG